jgi:GTP-binding protein HflX
LLTTVDAGPDPTDRARLLARYPHAIAISARTGDGIPALARAASDCLGRGFRDVDVRTDPGNGRLLAWLGRHGEVLSRHFTDDHVTVHCRIPAALLGQIAPQEATVTPHVSAGERPLATHDDVPAR